MTNHPDAWTSDQAYEPYVGRWSRLVAERTLAADADRCPLNVGATISRAVYAAEA